MAQTVVVGGMSATMSDAEESAFIIFLGGCPWRCPHCINKDLQTGGKKMMIEEVYDAINNSKKYITTVIFSGGEPTGQYGAVRDIAEFAHHLGLKTAIETCGCYPTNLDMLVGGGFIDEVYLDAKNNYTIEGYEKATGGCGDSKEAIESLHKMIKRGKLVEVRTTVFPDYPSARDLALLGDYLQFLGVKRWVVQRGLPTKWSKFESVPKKWVEDALPYYYMEVMIYGELTWQKDDPVLDAREIWEI